MDDVLKHLHEEEDAPKEEKKAKQKVGRVFPENKQGRNVFS